MARLSSVASAAGAGGAPAGRADVTIMAYVLAVNVSMRTVNAELPVRRPWNCDWAFLRGEARECVVEARLKRDEPVSLTCTRA